MMMAGSLHPPFSLFGCAEKRKRAVHGPKEKRRWGENLAAGQVSPMYGGCSRPVRAETWQPLPARVGPPSRRSLDPREETSDRGCWVVDGRPPLRFPRFRAGLEAWGGLVSVLLFLRGGEAQARLDA